MEDVYTKVSGILTDKLGIAKSVIKPGASFSKDLGIDSLDYVELIMDFEEVFDIRIADSEGENIKTVGEAANYIEQKIREE